jgi:hypothetical protein
MIDLNPAQSEDLRNSIKQSDTKTNISRLLHEVQQNRNTHNLILKEEQFKVGYSTRIEYTNKTLQHLTWISN